jgi:hypothetical protein
VQASVSVTACPAGTAALPGALTITYALTQSAGATPVAVAAAANAALAALSPKVALGAEGAGLGVEWAPSLGGGGALFSLATGLRCGGALAPSSGLLDARSGFPADRLGAPVPAPFSPPFSAPGAYASAPATLVCSSCFALPPAAAPACAPPGAPRHRFNASGAAPGVAAYTAADAYGRAVAVRGAVTNVSDVGAAASASSLRDAIPALFDPLPIAAGAPPPNITRTPRRDALVGATSAAFLSLNPDNAASASSASASASSLRRFSLSGAGGGLTLILTFLLPDAPFGAASQAGLFQLGASSASASAFSQRFLAATVNATGGVALQLRDEAYSFDDATQA